MDGLDLRQAVVFLAAAGIVIPLVQRLRVSPVLGFLLIGIAVGPFGFAHWSDQLPWLNYITITDVSGVKALAELGVVFLLFMIGLELSLERLWAMRRLVVGLGGAQILFCTLAISALAYAFGNPVAASFVLGASLALSSTAIVIQLLSESGRFGTRVGQGSFAILLAQDLAIVPILFLIGAFSPLGDDELLPALAWALAQALLAVSIILGIGRLAVRPLLRMAKAARSPELFVAATLLIIIGTAAATHAAGLSAALGAFLIGLLFAETEFRYDIEVDIAPFKGLLLGLFFMSIGMSIDTAEVASQPGWIAASVVGLIVLKATITAVCAIVTGFTRAQAIETGLLTGQGGEFAFVAIGLSLSLALMPEETGQFMLIVVSATMILTPLLAVVARSVGRALDGTSPADDVALNIAEGLNGHIIIVGFGRTGQLLAAIMEQHRFETVAIDNNPLHATSARQSGTSIFVGDASRASMLAKFHPETAAAIAVSTDNPEAAERVLAAAQELAPHTPIILRAHDDRHAERLRAQGATLVVPEVEEAGLQIALQLLEHGGMSPEAALETVALERARISRPD